MLAIQDWTLMRLCGEEIDVLRILGAPETDLRYIQTFEIVENKTIAASLISSATGIPIGIVRILQRIYIEFYGTDPDPEPGVYYSERNRNGKRRRGIKLREIEINGHR